MTTSRKTAPGRAARLAGLIAGAAALAGCEAAGPVLATAGAVSIATVVTTDKTIPDHVVSLATGHDCSTVRYSAGGYYCTKPLPANRPLETRLYCYRSIGKITCYDKEIPGEEARLVTDPRHVISSRTVSGPMTGPMPGQQ